MVFFFGKILLTVLLSLFGTEPVEEIKIVEKPKEQEIMTIRIDKIGVENKIYSKKSKSNDIDKNYSYFRKIVSALKKDLNNYGLDELLIQNVNSYSVDTSLLRCDYYDYLTGQAEEERSYKGEFMTQYEWAEEYIYSLENY